MQRVLGSRRAAGGFSLVELLAVVAILAVLMALLLPAVQAARESARVVQCRNNLKQIGLAVQAHAHGLGAFPGGGRPYSNARTKLGGAPSGYDSQWWTWSYQILPYLEHQQLWENPDDAFVAATPVVHYFCPTRRPPTALKGGYWASHNVYRAQLDYAGNAGTTRQAGDGGGILGNGRDGAICRLDAGIRRVDQIRDGLSVTLLVGEKRLNVRYCRTDQQPDDNDGYVGGFQDDVVRWGTSSTHVGPLTPAPDFVAGQYTWSTIRPSIWQFGSSHVAGPNVVLCDGSVRPIGFDVDPQTFERLCAIRDGNPVDTSGL